MGWTIKIELDKPVSKQQLRGILAAFPADLQSPFVRGALNEQGWGWSMAVDVWWPEGKEEVQALTLHGAYSMSGHKAEPFRDLLCQRLAEAGFAAEAGEVQG